MKRSSTNIVEAAARPAEHAECAERDYLPLNEVESGGERGQERLSVPRIVLARGLLAVLHRYVTHFLKAHGAEFETGGMLLGCFQGDKSSAKFTLTGFIDAGPGANVSPNSVLFDGDYQQRMLQAIRQGEVCVGNMGCIHVHPGSMDRCSEGDYLADVAAVRESDTRALVFGIITVNNHRLDPLSIHYRNFKLDFFVLAESTNMRYVHVRPVLERITALKAPGAGATGSRRLNSKVVFAAHRASVPGMLADKKRLVAEVRAMEERYRERAVLRYRGNLLYWDYTVMESGRRFPIEVRYPRRYPLEPPRIISVLPLPSSPHQLVNNELCWINRASGDWNPARDTAATSISAAHRWFACLLVYISLGQWPEEANDDAVRPI